MFAAVFFTMLCSTMIGIVVLVVYVNLVQYLRYKYYLRRGIKKPRPEPFRFPNPPPEPPDDIGAIADSLYDD